MRKTHALQIEITKVDTFGNAEKQNIICYFTFDQSIESVLKNNGFQQQVNGLWLKVTAEGLEVINESKIDLMI